MTVSLSPARTAGRRQGFIDALPAGRGAGNLKTHRDFPLPDPPRHGWSPGPLLVDILVRLLGQHVAHQRTCLLYCLNRIRRSGTRLVVALPEAKIEKPHNQETEG